MGSFNRDEDGTPVPAEDSRALVEAAKSSGSKTGGGASVARDTLFTNATVRLVDLIGEGEINGIVGGLKGVYLNNTPIENADGSRNFQGISVDSRSGTPGQTYMPGYPDVETPLDVGVQVKKALPVTATVTDPSANRARITLQIPSLLYADSKGNVNAWRIDFLIQARYSGGPWVNQLGALAVQGKASSAFFPSYEIDLPRNPSGASAPWQIQVVRLSDDTETSNTQFPNMQFASDLIYQSLTTIVDAKFTYPNSAIVGITADASQFGSSLPQRQYLVDGIRMRVPANYDPVARTYAGIWDGTFKEAWCNNPAWVLYMLLENDRFGLGQLIDVSAIDKWSLYQIAAYCDGPVPDGRGGQEPRFTFNGVIAEQQDAFDLLELVAQVFRGMTYWSSGTVTATQDRPGDVRLLVTEANVIEGEFSYASSGRQARHTVAIVAWNDPTDLYRTNYEVVEDPAGVARYGYNPTKVDLLGCTSRGQAHRAGLWTLLTELQETQVLTYHAGLDHAVVRPGDLIAVQDPQIAAVDLSGRLLAGSTQTVLRLDRPVTVGSEATVSVTMPDGTVAERGVQPATAATEISLTGALPAAPDPAAVWVVATTLKPQLFRVISIKEDEPHIYSVQALQHEPGKYATVDTGAPFEELPISNFPSTVLPPTNLSVMESVYYELGQAKQALTLSWTAGQPFNSVGYYVTAIKPDGAIVTLPQRASASADFTDVAAGTWTFIVTAIGLTRAVSAPAQITYDVVGWGGRQIAKVVNLRVLGGGQTFVGRACTVEWDYEFPGGYDAYPIRPVAYVYDASSGALLHREILAQGVDQWTYAYDTNVNEGGPRRQFRVAVSATDPAGAEGNQTSLLVNNPPPALVNSDLDSAPGFLFIAIDQPSDKDWVGYLHWISETSGFDPLVTPPTLDVGSNFTSVPRSSGTYYVRSAAYDAFGKTPGELNISAEEPVTISDVAFDPTDPGIPQGLALTTGVDVAPDGTVTGWVKGTWDAITTENLGLYEVAMREGTGGWITVGSVEKGVQEFNRRGLVPGSSISVRVRSISENGFGISGWSTVQTITVALNTTPPGPATNLTGSAASQTATLRWMNPAAKDLAYIEVWEGATDVLANAAQIGSATRDYFVGSGLTPASTRYYWVRPVNTSGFAAASFTGPLALTTIKIDGVYIGDDTITATQIAGKTITADQIASQTITAAEIKTGTITADQINMATIKLGPDGILVGDGTLSSVFAGSNSTKINGGAILANTIGANLLKIGVRGITVSGIEFAMERNAAGALTGNLTWTAGKIVYVDDTGATVSSDIAAGAGAINGIRSYVWWCRRAGVNTALQFANDTSTPSVAATINSDTDNIILCVSSGTTGLMPIYGGTIIDGTKITTRSIAAEMIASDAIQTRHMTAKSINGDRISAGTLSADTINGGTITAGVGIYVGNDRFELRARGAAYHPDGSIARYGGAIGVKDNGALYGRADRWRVALGALRDWGYANDDFGLVLWDKDGNEILNSGSNGAAARVNAAMLNGPVPGSSVPSGVGSNILPNAAMFLGTQYYSYGSSNPFVTFQFGRNIYGQSYSLWGGNTLSVAATNSTPISSGDFLDIYMFAPTSQVAGPAPENGNSWDRHTVEAGKNYEFSAYVHGHRLSVIQVIIEFYNANRQNTGTAVWSTTTDMDHAAYVLNHYQRVGGVFRAPGDTYYALPFVRGYCRNEVNPILFVTQPMFGPAREGQTELSPYNPGNGGVAIDAANLTTYIRGAIIGDAQINQLTAAKIAVGNLQALNTEAGTITGGMLRSKDNRFQVNLDAGQILIYD
ncbi:putative phage tail protein [Methylobacterium sp. BE186]|uniref:TipJ family phage tail tip protein n=1 Tax=Methylobacterium sp. BE186 TaxID=2817715 RepID=UPI0028630C60|nr:phage tail protein [Methylobacterium sp. BE186]MDR7036100.1 putative phage tail protein [Methylobacterium sp. BE186]